MAYSSNQSQLKLYSSRASNSSARLRIALSLKGIPYKLMPINLSQLEHYSPEYTALNPSQTVPLLIAKDVTGSPIHLKQSLAALEYLEEAFPSTPRLLPPPEQLAARAQVRTLVDIVATDIHPLCVNRVADRISVQFPSVDVESGMDGWNAYWLKRGLAAYDEAAKMSSRKYSVGNEVTLADVVLMPELWAAERLGVDLKSMPNVQRIYQNLREVELIQKEQSGPE